jgi:hypothetical protein
MKFKNHLLSIYRDMEPKYIVGSERHKTIADMCITERYLAAHVHNSGRVGLNGLTHVGPARAHVRTYGGTVRYGWVVTHTESDTFG